MNEFAEKMRKEIDALADEPFKPRLKSDVAMPDVARPVPELPFGFVIADGAGGQVAWYTDRVADRLPEILRDLDQTMAADGHWTLTEYAQGVVAITLAVTLMPGLSAKGHRFLAHDRIDATFFGALPFAGLRGIPFASRILKRLLKPATCMAVNAICTVIERLLDRPKPT